MIETHPREKLLLQVIHFLSEKFKETLVLEGGMLLRLFNSPRSTQDVDYYWISEKSKKVLTREIRTAFDTFQAGRVTDIRLNSRGIFLDMESAEQETGKIMIELNVVPSLNLPSEFVSTASVSNRYALTGRIVATIALPEAFAHKIAAALERETARDIHDIAVFESLCEFDQKTLEERLRTLSIQRNKPAHLTFPEAAGILENRARNLTEESLKEELYSLIPESQRPGLLYTIKAAVMRIVQKLRAINMPL